MNFGGILNLFFRAKREQKTVKQKGQMGIDRLNNFSQRQCYKFYVEKVEKLLYLW